MSELKEKESYKNEIRIAVIATIVIMVLWLLSWHLININIPSGDRGIFGDMFGAINSLFSGFAFAGIIFTIFLQRKELELQRNELALTRAVFEGQAKMLAQQTFENTFFQLLNLHNSITNSLDLRKIKAKADVVAVGKDCFEAYYKRMEAEIKSDEVAIITFQNCDIEQAKSAYKIVYKIYRSDLSHYFRTLYHIIKFIDQSDIEDKKKYTSIVRAQLSSYEQIMLLYNGLLPQGEKFKPLITKYDLLQNIDEDLVFNSAHLKEY